MAILTTLSRPTAQFPPTSQPSGGAVTHDPAAPSNSFLCNFANNGHRNLIQLSNRCARC